MSNYTWKSWSRMSLSHSLIILCSIMVVTSCDDVVEEDLSGKEVLLLSPPDQFQSNSGSIEFNWAIVEGADSYHLKVVTPSFDSLVNIRLDTMISGGTFTYPFSPGSYEWCLRAVNNTSTGDYNCRFFQVDSITSLQGVSVPLTLPQQGHISNFDSITFQWQEVENALEYKFSLYENDIQGPIEHGPEILSSTEIRIAVNEGLHAWSVQALGSNSNSEVSFRSMTIDRTAPTAAILDYPSPNVSFPTGTVIIFTWQAGSDELTSVIDSLFLYPSGSSVPLYVSIGSAPSISTDTLAVGSYEWKITSSDEAGNMSSSDTNLFEIE